jgi:hypothetical protein
MWILGVGGHGGMEALLCGSDKEKVYVDDRAFGSFGQEPREENADLKWSWWKVHPLGLES